MSVVALLTGFLALCVIGALATVIHQRSPLIWIVLTCVGIDAAPLAILFNTGWLR